MITLNNMITKTSLQHQAEKVFLLVKNKVVVIVIDHKLYAQRLKFCIYYFCIHRYIFYIARMIYVVYSQSHFLTRMQYNVNNLSCTLNVDCFDALHRRLLLKVRNRSVLNRQQTCEKKTGRLRRSLKGVRKQNIRKVTKL